eukprot:jgi/Tetstr1/436583/TSEL_025380.t1
MEPAHPQAFLANKFRKRVSPFAGRCSRCGSKNHRGPGCKASDGEQLAWNKERKIILSIKSKLPTGGATAHLTALTEGSTEPTSDGDDDSIEGSDLDDEEW